MRLLLIVWACLSSQIALAEIVFAPGVTYSSQKYDDGTGSAEYKSTVFDLKLGYVHPSGLYLGAMYSIINPTFRTGEKGGFAAGPTLGYQHYSGFYTLFTYHIVADHQWDAGTKYTNGMGPQMDFGWVFPLTTMFSIGPQITYRSLTFDKQEVGGATNTVDYKITSVNPAISLWFRF